MVGGFEAKESIIGDHSGQALVLNSLLCFISNYHAELTPARLVRIIGQHYPTSAMRQAYQLLLQLRVEGNLDACKNGRENSNREENTSPNEVLSLYHALGNLADRVVFAVSELDTLPPLCAPSQGESNPGRESR